MILETIKFITMCLTFAFKAFIYIVSFVLHDDSDNSDSVNTNKAYDFGNHYNHYTGAVDVSKRPNRSYSEDMYESIYKSNDRL